MLQLTIVGTSNMSKLTTGMWLIVAAETFMNAWLAFFMVTNKKVFNISQWARGETRVGKDCRKRRRKIIR